MSKLVVAGLEYTVYWDGFFMSVSYNSPGRGLNLSPQTWPDPAEFAFSELVDFSTEAAEGSQAEKKDEEISFSLHEGDFIMGLGIWTTDSTMDCYLWKIQDIIWWFQRSDLWFRER